MTNSRYKKSNRFLSKFTRLYFALKITMGGVRKPQNYFIHRAFAKTLYNDGIKFNAPAPAAAAAKPLQSCPTLCNPIDSSSPGSPVPGVLQARTLEWVAISVSNA